LVYRSVYKHTIELYINLDRITVLRSYESFLEDVYLPYLKGLLEVMLDLLLPFSVKEGDSLKLTSSISAKVEELRRIVSITHIGLIYYTTDSLLAKSNNLVSLSYVIIHHLAKSHRFSKNTQLKTTMF
jgi:hypothetical protein